MESRTSKILILYSNPVNTSRLRLDKEHREIDHLIQKHGWARTSIKQIHATSIQDLFDALNEDQYDIIQFSGHGEEDGIYLESSHIDGGTFISAKQLATILCEKAPSLKLSIFISCYSAASIPDLISVSPYLVTLKDKINDTAAIHFISKFYESYFKTNSVKKAFFDAQKMVDLTPSSKQLNAILSRRGLELNTDRTLIQVFPQTQYSNSIIIDITDAELDILKLDISKDDFLTILTKKIRIHKQIFASPREKGLISVGQYFGIFSWTSVDDVVICHRILKVKDDVNEALCIAWAKVLVFYNDLYLGKYRTERSLNEPILKSWLEEALELSWDIFELFFGDKEEANILRSAVPKQYKMTKAIINAHLEMADSKFYKGDYPSAVSYLEMSLSSIHDLMNTMTQELTE